MAGYEMAAEYVNRPGRILRNRKPNSAHLHMLTACSREAASFRLVRLWMWIPIHDAEFETEVQDVVWEDLEE